MYLTQLQHLDVKPGKWPGNADVLMLNCCFDIADATLNSWKEAHDAFSKRTKDPENPKKIFRGVHSEFTRLVVKAFETCEEPGTRSFATNKFPSETLAYAVLVAWIENEETEKCLKKIRVVIDLSLGAPFQAWSSDPNVEILVIDGSPLALQNHATDKDGVQVGSMGAPDDKYVASLAEIEHDTTAVDHYFNSYRDEAKA